MKFVSSLSKNSVNLWQINHLPTKTSITDYIKITKYYLK